MRWLSFSIILFIATLLEAGNLLNIFAAGGWYLRPSILITLLTYYALTCRTHEVIICSFVIGFATDLATGLMGPHTVCYGLMGLLLNQSNQTLAVRQAVYQALLVFAVYLVADTTAFWLGTFKDSQNPSDPYSALLLTGLYSAVISPLVWSILSVLTGGGTDSSKTRSERT
ncbi:MAG: rod shape-determining protein MreD [Planctomycetales bacterium]|nr:rod shape-determining protein MreD [Planctomycetales bacterium]